jgi:polyhydroxyalkanoate synthesis regulator phasin
MSGDEEKDDMNMNWRVLAVAVAVIVVAGGAVGTARYVSAQSGGGSGSAQGQQLRDDFLNHLAGNLNVPVDELKQAFKDAGSQTVDDAVAGGRLTQEQGDKIKERIAGGDGFGPGALRGRHGKGGLGGGVLRGKVRDGIISSAATALNMDAADLKTELKSGKSIADVAVEKSVSLDTVKAQITAAANSKLDELVSNGKLTQDQEDKALQKLSDSLDNILNKKRQPKPAP